MARRRQRYRTRIFLWALVAAGALVLSSRAAVAQSVEVRINLTKGDLVDLSGVDDWTIGIHLPTDTISIFEYRWDGQCVHSTSGAFRVEVTSRNGNGRLALVSDSGDRMQYELWTYSRERVSNAFELEGFTRSPVVLTERVGSLSPNCNGGVNLWFAALVRERPFNRAPAGIYRDVATIYVTPE